MSRPTVNRIVFLKRNYKRVEDLYYRISQQVQLLMETGYVCVISEVYSGEGAIVIEFNPNAVNIDLQQPHWLYPDEAEYLENYQRDVEIDNLEQELDELREQKELDEDDVDEFFRSEDKKNNKGDA
jgi:hypothetical protein